MLNINTSSLILGMILAIIIPLITSFINRQQWPDELLGLTTLALSLGNGILITWKTASDAHQNFDWRTAVIAAAGTFLLAAQARARIWISTKLDAKLYAIGSKKTTPAAQAA